MPGISRLLEDLLASQEGLPCMELVWWRLWNGEKHNSSFSIKINDSHTCEIWSSKSSVAKDKGLPCGAVRGDLRTSEMPGTTNPTTHHHTPEHLNSRPSYFLKFLFFLGGKKVTCFTRVPLTFQTFKQLNNFNDI